MSPGCSHCDHNGHYSKTCLDSKGGFKLFGVRLSIECCMESSTQVASECSSSSTIAMRKSASMGNLSHYGAAEGGASLSPLHFERPDPGDPLEGYASDDLVHTNSSSRERKKGVPWTEEEHRTFLLGLKKLGKGDWRGISRNYVKTRTPTQVASHAQKYFLRQNNVNKRRRRSSLFDITPDTVPSVLEEPLLEEAGDEDPDVCAELSLGQSIPYGSSRVVDATHFSGHGHPVGYFPLPVHHFPIGNMAAGASDMLKTGSNVMKANTGEADTHCMHRSADVDAMEVVPEVVDVAEGDYNLPHSAFRLPYAPLWLYGMPMDEVRCPESKIVKPTPINPRPLHKVDEAVTRLDLAVNMTKPVMEPTPLSYKLLEEGSRHSAFHVTAPANGNREVEGQGSLSSAISVP